jgi:adenylate cyclase
MRSIRRRTRPVALDAERLRSSRVLARIRFIGISIAFVFNALMPVFAPGQAEFQGSVALFAAYWLAAAAIHTAVRRSDRAARLVGLDIPLVDMPAAFALQHPLLGRQLDVTAAVLGFTYFALFTMAAAFSLDRRRIAFAAVMGFALESVLLLVAGANALMFVTLAMVMWGVAVACRFLTDRTIQLVYDVAAEQRRRERLGRYFSPQVAAAVDVAGETVATGDRREITVLFSDLRDFSALAEPLDSAAVVEC